jgi:hypothetical protein
VMTFVPIARAANPEQAGLIERRVQLEWSDRRDTLPRNAGGSGPMSMPGRPDHSCYDRRGAAVRRHQASTAPQGCLSRMAADLQAPGRHPGRRLRRVSEAAACANSAGTSPATPLRYAHISIVLYFSMNYPSSPRKRGPRLAGTRLLGARPSVTKVPVGRSQIPATAYRRAWVPALRCAPPALGPAEGWTRGAGMTESGAMMMCAYRSATPAASRNANCRIGPCRHCPNFMQGGSASTHRRRFAKNPPPHRQGGRHPLPGAAVTARDSSANPPAPAIQIGIRSGTRRTTSPLPVNVGGPEIPSIHSSRTEISFLTNATGNA